MVKTGSQSRKKAKRYHIELSPISVLLWSIFSFFLLICIFVLGIFVGRGFLPGSVTTISDLRSQIKKLHELVSSKEPYDSRTYSDSDNNPKLDFYEKLTSKKEEVKNNWKPDERADIQEREMQTQETDELKKSTADERDIIEVRPKREPETSPLAAQYTVQIASIGDIHKAEQVINELIDKGYDAYFYEAQVNGKTYYRISCGKFASRGDAQKYALKLETEAGLEGLVLKIE